MCLNTQVKIEKHYRERGFRLNMMKLDKIDIISYANKSKRIVGQIKDLCAIIAGLLVSGDYKIGAQYFSKKNIRDNAPVFQLIFEAGRR
jgi:hypothetical protein